jgi:SAM-dependent methyltransferase
MDHPTTTIDQFTRQAAGFGAAAAMNDADAMKLLLAAARAVSVDTVLDVACGPGIVVAAFAREAAEVTGIDLTPAMIALARERCASEGLLNVRFEIGDVERLPYADASFSVVVCRYALHHMLRPQAVIREMARVCAPGGRVVVADVVVGGDVAVADRFNDVERLRDPSHVRAMATTELIDLLRAAGLARCAQASFYPVSMELGALLSRSAAPNPDAVTNRFQHAIDSGEILGLSERRDGHTIRFEFPISIVVGECPIG